MERPEFRPVPPIPEDLLKDLEARFPARCPKIDETDRQIWIYAGQRSVVEFLRKAHERQIESRFNNVQQ
jgi:hypothetical protein